MGSEDAPVDSHLTDINLLLLENDNVCSALMPNLLKTRNYEVVHFQNMSDAFESIDDTNKAVKVVFTSIGIAGSSKGCNSLRHIGNEMIMPVVFFPEKDKESLIQALDVGGVVTLYHIKNVNLEDLEYIWHHIFIHKQRKKEAISTLDNASKYPQQNHADSSSTSVIPDIEQSKGSSGTGSEGAKKARVAWTIELNNRFIEYYNQLGHQGATPCRILELMKEPRLTRFHIASHLQKYRAHLREMQEELNPRRSKFSYNTQNYNLSSVNHKPQEPVRNGANDDPNYTHQPPVNLAASFTKFLSNTEDITHVPNSNKFNDIYSMFQKCVNSETCSTSYVGFKVSNDGELLWDKSNSKFIDEVANMDTKLQPSPLQEEPNCNSGYDVVESPATFDAEMLDFDIYDMLDFDSSIL